jgi:hypothetical protein
MEWGSGDLGLGQALFQSKLARREEINTSQKNLVGVSKRDVGASS